MLIIASTLVTSSSYALFCVDRGDRFVLKYRYAKEFRTRGEFEAIKIRQLIRNFCNVHPRFPVQEVILVAKSRFGHGKAYAETGDRFYPSWQSYEQWIGGIPEEFHSEDKYTFYRIPFYIPRGERRTGLRVNIRGNIKVKKIVLIKGFRGPGW